MLVLLRHGESTFNESGLFSGWSDCPLTPGGIQEAHDAALELRKTGICFDACFTSVLARAVETADIVLSGLGQRNVPVTRSWTLNERNYGTLEGVPRKDAVALYGAAQVEAWRNTPDAIPPPLGGDDARHPCRSSLYAGVAPELLPASETLRQSFRRVVDFFEAEVRPVLDAGGHVLLVSHGNPVRALVAHLEGLPFGEVPIIQIKNARPIIYRPDETGQLVGELHQAGILV